jgi:hypothetical protein
LWWVEIGECHLRDRRAIDLPALKKSAREPGSKKSGAAGNKHFHPVKGTIVARLGFNRD